MSKITIFNDFNIIPYTKGYVFLSLLFIVWVLSREKYKCLYVNSQHSLQPCCKANIIYHWPILIQSVISKVFESLILDLQFFKFNITYLHPHPERHGFRSGKSTTTNPFVFSDYVMSAFSPFSIKLIVFIWDFKMHLTGLAMLI